MPTHTNVSLKQIMSSSKSVSKKGSNVNFGDLNDGKKPSQMEFDTDGKRDGINSHKEKEKIS